MKDTVCIDSHSMVLNPIKDGKATCGNCGRRLKVQRRDMPYAKAVAFYPAHKKRSWSH